jgi:hypothetical protein
MKVRNISKKRSQLQNQYVEKGMYVINKKIDLNKDKDSYSQNTWGRYPKKTREVL